VFAVCCLEVVYSFVNQRIPIINSLHSSRTTFLVAKRSLCAPDFNFAKIRFFRTCTVLKWPFVAVKKTDTCSVEVFWVSYVPGLSDSYGHLTLLRNGHICSNMFHRYSTRTTCAGNHPLIHENYRSSGLGAFDWILSLCSCGFHPASQRYMALCFVQLRPQAASRWEGLKALSSAQIQTRRWWWWW